MHLDGRVVGQALASRLRPVLLEHGFHRFHGRNAWRRSDFTVGLISFPSMNAYVAAGVGCTTYSFSGAAGVYYPALDHGAPVEWPRDYQLTFRGVLGKTIRQPYFHPSGISDGSDRADVWHVLEDGSNLEVVVEDAVETVLAQAVPFIDRLDDPRQAMQSLLHEEGRNPGFGSLGLLSAGRGSEQHTQDVDRLRALLG
ncbi:hypothetical protein [Agromyces binzhouensis]|uniref:DUF4304 domain-containing protein n=1 Tax=Agromyces binzhouensis TaxID=1817495 RepID=A0A4Q2JWR5_9MICO|nr:hypothetical protein [Agromyces binzhouensis]RXZ51864.1 hypothetical protein ESO86_00495 [Agromyces binzhouensis]